MGLIQGIGRIEVMGFGAHGMHTAALQLLDNKGRQLATHSRFSRSVDTFQYGFGESQAVGQREVTAIDIGPLLPTVIKVLGVDQDHLCKLVALPVIDHLLVIVQ